MASSMDFNSPSRACTKCDCKTLIKWKAQCKQCNKVLVSTHRHDYQSCDCPNLTSIDGGWDYCAIGGKDLNKIEVIK